MAIEHIAVIEDETALPTTEVLRDPAVRSAYLGRTHARDRDDTSTTVASDA